MNILEGCPKDRQQLHELVAFAPQCAVGFVKIVSISTDSLFLSNDLRLAVGASWPFLHDIEKIVYAELDIEEYTNSHNKPMIPQKYTISIGIGEGLPRPSSIRIYGKSGPITK